MGTLQLTGGTLNFGSGNLTISGGVSGSGNLAGSGSSNLTINTAGGLSGSLNFAGTGQMVGGLTVNVGSGNSVTLGSNLAVSGTVDLSGASNLNIMGDSLTIGGGLNGTGSIIVDSTTTIIINATGGLSSALSLIGTVGNFVVNTGNGSVTLGTDLTVAGTLSLQSGTLVLSSYDLNINGNISAGGSGMISSSVYSNISVNTSGSPSGSLQFSGSGNTVGNLNVSIGGNGSLGIGSNLTVGNLNFTGGTVNVGGNGLTISTGGSVTGTGSTSYVIATGSGFLSLQLNAGDTSWTNFAPVAIQLNSGSASGAVNVSAGAGIDAQGTTGVDLSLTQPSVDITYFIEPVNVNTTNLNMLLMWSSSMEVNGFSNISAYVSHYTGGQWDVTAAAAASAEAGGMFGLKRLGVSSFSPFAVFGAGAVTSIAEISSKGQFEIYPNPASDNLFVRNASGADLINMEVIDINGKVVAAYKLTDLTTNISLARLSAGNYFVKLYNDNMNEVKKFTKM